MWPYLYPLNNIFVKVSYFLHNLTILNIVCKPVSSKKNMKLFCDNKGLLHYVFLHLIKGYLPTLWSDSIRFKDGV